MTTHILTFIIITMFYYEAEKEVPYYEDDISAKEKDRDQKFMDLEKKE